MKNRDLADNFDAILDAIHEDLLICDEKGVVIKVSPTFEDVYGIKKDYAVGKTVYQLEKEGYFKPSITAKVIKNNKPVTMQQKNNRDRDILVTATPVFGANKELQCVVSFSRDITEILQLQKQYAKLETKMEKYTEEIHQLRKNAYITDGVIGRSEEMLKILETIKRISGFDANVLLLGASGVGKTMLARIVHKSSDRQNGPFIDINCAAIPENLLESELFGYEKGSFTGAGANGKVGLIELANGGSLLLDEISEMPLSLQAKLLKVIQDRVITRVGGTKEIKVDFRLITATNRNLEEMIEEGFFRKDLYYRLNVIKLEIPSLKGHSEDILSLLDHFLEKTNQKYGFEKSFHPQAIETLVEYHWPGNVRELMNVVEKTVMTSYGNTMVKKDLPKELYEKKVTGTEIVINDLEKAVEAFEGDIVRDAYQLHQTTVGVSRALNISQPTAYRKVTKYVKEENIRK